MSYSLIFEQQEIALVTLILRILRKNLFNRLPRLNKSFIVEKSTLRKGDQR